MDTRAERTNHSRPPILGLLALVFVIGLLGAVARLAPAQPSLRGDSANVVRGSAGIVTCLRADQFTGCDGFVADTTKNDAVRVGPFPLLQYLVSVPLQALGVSIEWTLRIFALLSAVSLVGIIGLAYRTVRRHAPPIWAPLATATLLASPLLWYGRTALGEELAACLILAAVVSALTGARPLIIAVLVAGACITKETNPPFVFALAAICILARTEAAASARRRRLVAVAFGTATGIALNVGFNVFRYASVRNTDYTRSALQVRNPAVFARLFAAQWVAPNGGIIWFWPLAPTLILAVAAISWRRRGSISWQSVAVPFVALLFTGQIILLSTWWAPFGWYAWGPRLILPLIPAMVVAVCVLGARDATLTLQRFLRSRLFVPAVAVALALGLLQAVALFNGRAVTQFFSNNTCTTGGSVFANPSGYYQCLNDTAWTRRPWMLQLGMHGLGTTQGRIVAIVFAGAIITLACIARVATRERGTRAAM